MGFYTTDGTGTVFSQKLLTNDLGLPTIWQLKVVFCSDDCG